MLTVGPDGALWIRVPFGFALYHPEARVARYVLFDGTVSTGELLYNLEGINNSLAYVPVGPTSLLAIDGNIFQINIALLSSQYDPTRTLTFDGSLSATLTDTTEDTVEVFDSHGLMVSLAKRTGEAISTATYVPGTGNLASIVDAAGSATSFAYDSNGHLHTIVDAAGRSTIVVVDPSGDLQSLTEPDGETYSFQYNAHRMIQKQSPDGDVTAYTYQADGSVATTTKPAPGDSYVINAAYSQPAQRDAQGNTIHVGNYTDPRGVTHAIQVDHRGQIDSDSYTANGQSYLVDYVKYPSLAGSDGQISPVKNTLMERVSFTMVNSLQVGVETLFDNFGRPDQLTKATGIYGPLGTVSYDANGRVSAFYRGPGNDSFNVDRDAAGRAVRIWQNYFGNATGQEERFTWNGPNGQADTITRHGVTTTMSFDPATGNPSSTTDSLGRTTTSGYDAAGNVAAFFDGQAKWSFVYDDNDRLTNVVDGKQNTTTLAYTQQGCGCTQSSLVTSIHTPDLPTNQSWQMTYGPEGRLATLVDPDGHAQSFTYEPTGELHTLTDALDNTTTATHDQLGRVSSILDALGRIHQRTYAMPTPAQPVGADMLTGSASSVPASSTMGSTPLSAGDYQIGGQVFDSFLVASNTTLTGDAFLTATAGTGYQDGTRNVPQVAFYQDATLQVSYGRQFDDALRTTKWADRSGLPFASSTVLDPANSQSAAYVEKLFAWTPDLPIPVQTVIESDYPAQSSYEDASATYGTYYDLATASGYGQVSNVVSDTYTRDPGGRLATFAREYVTSPYASAPLTTYTYEPTSDRLQSVVDADGTHTFAYDARGQVQTLTIQGEGTYTFGYDAVGRNNTLVYPDGHERVQSYDHEGRLYSRCYNYPNDGGAANRCYTAQYDPVGNPTTMTDPEGSDVIAYDNLYRVTQVTRKTAGQADIVESYGYNPIGALLTNAPETTGIALNDQRVRIGGSGPTDTAPSPVMASVNGGAVTVDPAGRVTSLNGWNLTFDKQGLLRSAAAGTSTETYYYDPQFRRYRRDFGGTTEYYVYEGANVVARLNASAQVQESYLYEGVDAPLRFKQAGGSNVYYELDLAGNVRRLRDSSGGDLGGFRYTAFGQVETADASTPAPSVTQGLSWKARWTVPVAGGLVDMRARWWSAQLGAFLSVDELALHDSNSTLWGWGNQNPVKWSDPSGRCPACVGAAVGWAAGYLYGTISYAATASVNQSPIQFLGNALGQGLEYGAAGAVAGAGASTLGVLSAGGTLSEAVGLAPLGGALIGVEGAPIIGDKIARQMGPRGWTPEQIINAIRSGQQLPAINRATGNAAVRYICPKTGQSVVVDTVTNEVIHVGGPGFQYGPGSGDLP